jgi:fibronectin-binding autotransporter adhesin
MARLSSGLFSGRMTRALPVACRLFLAALLAIAAVAPPASAQTQTWTTGNGGNGLFSNTLNWVSGTVPVAGNGLVFGATTGTTTLNNDLAAGTSVLGFTFTADAPAYTIGGNSLNLTNASPSFIVNSASDVTQTINNSFLNLQLNSPWRVTGSGNLNLGGALQNTAGWQGALAMNGTGLLTLSGSVSNAINLAVNAGTVVLAKTGSTVAFQGYRGNSWNGGTIKLGAANQTSSNVISIYLRGSTVDLNGFDYGSASLTGIGSLMGEGGLITNSASGTGTNTIYFAPNIVAGSYGGTIQDGATAKVALTFNRGRQILSGSNAFSGGATLAAALGTAIAEIADVRSLGAVGSRNLTFSAVTNQATLGIVGTAITDLSGFDSVAYATNANVGFDVQDSGNTFTLGTVTNGTGRLTKTGAGTMVLNGVNTYTGATTINGGILKVDYSSGGLASTTAPTFGGGELSLLGKSSGATSQTLGNVTVNAGGGAILVDGNGGTGFALTLGTIAPTAAGSTLDIRMVGSGNSATTTTTSVTNGLLGSGRVVFRDASANIDFAGIGAAGTNRTIQAATYSTGLPTAPNAATTNYSQTGDATVTTSGTVNALKLTTNAASQSLDIGGQTLTLTSGGLLFVGANDYAINNGNLKSNTATNSDLIVHQHGAGVLTINSVIANGVGASTLTKSGDGVLVLGGTNTYTGQTFVNGGTLSIVSNSQLGAVATGATLNLNGGTLALATSGSVALNNSGSNSRAVTVGGAGGGFDVAQSGTLNITGVISAQGQLTKSGSGTLTLSADNFVYGGLRIDEGIVNLNSSNALTAYSNPSYGDNAAAASLTFGAGAAPTLQLNGRSTSVLSLVSANTSAVVENTHASTAGTITVYNGADNTFAGILRNGSGGALALAKTGGGMLTLSNTSNSFSGGVTIFNGILSGTQGALGSGTITLANGTLRASGSFSNAIASTAGVSGAAVSYVNNTIDTSTGDATFSGVLSGSGAVMKTGSGLLVLSNAANTFTGSLASTSGTVSFASLASTAALTMAGGNFAATGNTTVGSVAANTSGTIALPAANNSYLTVNSLTGSGALTVNGTGSMYFTGLALSGTSNSGFSGTLTMGNTLLLANENLLGTNANALTMNGGRLVDNGSALTIANHRITLGGYITIASAETMTITGGITGVGGITARAASARAIVLGGTNDYAGVTEIYTDSPSNSTLRLAATNALPSGSGKGDLTLTVWSSGAATLDLAGYNATVNGLTQAGNGAGGRIIDNVSAGGNATLTLGAGNATGNTFNGIIRNTTGTVSLTKIGTGIQTLGGTNTYAGATTISGGTLALGLNGSFANSSLITIGSAGSLGAVLDLTAKTGTFAFGPAQTVGGIGTLRMDANDTVLIAGLLSPGNSPGILTFNGGTTLLSGTTQMEIFGGVRGTDYDAIDLVNNAILDYAGGTLFLDFGSWLADQQTYQLFGNGSSSLQGDLFAVTIAGSNYSGLTFTGSNGVWTSSGASPSGQTLTFTESTGQLVIVPEPGAIALTGIGVAMAGWTFWKRRRAARVLGDSRGA